MEIHCIADLHGKIPVLPGGDILIVAGDLTYSGERGQTYMFFSWLDSLPYENIVVIAGNHDRFLANVNIIPSKAHYLMNSSIEINGIVFWGSPYTIKFNNWVFGESRGYEMRKIWNKIPDDADILVTHGPPYQIMDKNVDGEHCGCLELRRAIARIRPQFVVYGHIHEEYGQQEIDGITYVNCSYLDENYEPRFQFQRITYGI